LRRFFLSVMRLPLKTFRIRERVSFTLRDWLELSSRSVEYP
jgi:hypothetical protein